jgi:hypothetical protein
MIRKELVAIELAAARRGLVKELLCTACQTDEPAEKEWSDVAGNRCDD